MNNCYCNPTSSSQTTDGGDSSQQTLAVTLTFLRKELLYDIGNYAYVEAGVMPNEDLGRRFVQDITQDGNIDRVTRVMTLAFSEVQEFLFPFTKVEVEDGTADDDTLTEPTEYVLSLAVPQGFSSTTVELWKNLIHEYIVCRVLADWFSIVKPQVAQSWAVKAAATVELIRKASNKRTGRTRRGWSPF